MSLSSLGTPVELLLASNGFAVQSTDAGNGSGGPFESAVWSRVDRRFFLSLRHDSLAVRYEIGTSAMDHQEYMRALLGPGGPNRFPSYSQDPAAAFEALTHDLRTFCDDFFQGDGSTFRRLASEVRSESAMTGFQRIQAIEERLRGD